MARRPTPTLTDYAVVAISPALIMTLVGSLVFFLIEVFYLGEYDGRLNFIMAMFVMAAVCIARISIENGRDYALLFAIPLGIVTALATIRFVQFSGPFQSFSVIINIGLIALIWWCADKLTWDSTVIDESKDASGEGLLQTVGLNKSDSGSESPSHDTDGTTAREQPRQLSMWQRFVEHRRRPHSPGVWVIYFSLAALPIFGFGNWFIPSSDLESRRYVFKLLVVYVASALGLLLTTSLLGLRRYLRQRRLEMPLEMTSTWLGTGAAMVVALLLICTLLPRRSAEYSVTQLPIFAGSPSDLWTTEYAVGNEGQEDPENADRTGEKDQGEAGSNKQNGDQQSSGDQQQSGNDSQGKNSQGQSQSDGDSGDSGKRQQESSNQGSNKSKSGQKGDSSSSQQGDNQGEQGQQQGKDSGEQGDTDSQNKDGEDKDQSKATSANNRSKNGKSDSRNRSKSNGRQQDKRSQQPGSSTQTENDSREQKNDPQQDQRNRTASDGSSSQKSRPQARSKFNPSKIGSAIGGSIGQLLKLLYWLAVILIVGYLVWRYHREIMAAVRNFIQALREFWESLFGRKHDEAVEVAAAAAPAGPPPKPFSAFADPFLTGMAQQRPPAEVIRYSFEAFEAWAREHGYPRGPEQTPHEYAQLVGQYQTTLARDAASLAELYCRCAYGKDPAPRSSVEHLRRLWEQLRATAA